VRKTNWFKRRKRKS